MKKYLILGATILALAGCTKKIADVGGGIGGDFSGSSKDKVFTGSLMAAVKLGVPFKCSYKVNQMDAEGWVKGKNYRGKMQQQGKVTEVIMKDNCMWSWSEGEKQGIKTCYDPAEADKTMWGGLGKDANTPDSATTPEVEYHCRPAVIGNEKFTPPTDVNFMNLEEMMQAAGVGNTGQ